MGSVSKTKAEPAPQEPVAKEPKAPEQPFTVKGAKVEDIRPGVARVTWEDGMSCTIGYGDEPHKGEAIAIAWRRARD